MYRIAILNTQMEAAGAQKALLTLAKLLQAQGHIVQVITMYDKGDFVATFQRQYGLEIIDLQMKQPGQRSIMRKLWDALRGLWRLYRLLRRGRYDVLQSFSHYSNILGPFVGWAARIPIRVSSQRMSLKGAPEWLLRLDRLVTNSFLVSTMVTVSDGTRQFCIEEQGIDPNKLITIYNSIDTKRFAPVSDERQRQLRHALGLPVDAPVVITVARLHPQKGHSDLLAALPEILAADPDTHFLWVGEGELRHELEAQIAALELGSAVRLLGVRQDIPELLALSDIFVLPSHWEGLPNSVLEAMAAELPVVATEVDGTPEVVQNNVTGLLVPPGDPETLSNAVCRLLQEPALRTEMGRAGRDRAVREFSESRNVAAFETLYRRLQATGKSTHGTTGEFHHER